MVELAFTRSHFFVISFLLAALFVIFTPAQALTGGPADAQSVIFPEDRASNKWLAAAIAFGVGAISSGWALSRAGSAGLAGAAERPEIFITVLIVNALAEALAIYGVAIAVLILIAPV